MLEIMILLTLKTATNITFLIFKARADFGTVMRLIIHI